MTSIKNLFIKFHPIIYFHKKEPYLPVDMDDILKIADVSSDNIPNLVKIPKDKRFNVKLGTQILCKTYGEYKIGEYTYIDLVYIVTFTWNGTLEEHAFDKEEIIIRLIKKDNEYKVLRVFGSAHGNGYWYLVDKNDVEFENGHPVMYSANESHAMYNRPRLYRRIFNFGSDKTSNDNRWEPSEFVIFDNNINIYYKDNTQKIGNFEYFKTKAEFGNEKNSQPWPGSLSYDVINLDTCYKYEGGIDNLFTGRTKKIKPSLRIAFRTLTMSAWIGFIAYLIFRDILSYKAKEYSIKEFILYIILHTFIVLVLFITGTILGLEIFVLNPINTPN